MNLDSWVLPRLICFSFPPAFAIWKEEAYLILHRDKSQLHLFTTQELGECLRYTKLNQACQWSIIFPHAKFHLQVKGFLLNETQLSWYMYIVGPRFIPQCSVLKQMLKEYVKVRHAVSFIQISHVCWWSTVWEITSISPNNHVHVCHIGSQLLVSSFTATTSLQTAT